MTSPSKEEIIENDNKYAKWYDFLERLSELLGLKGVRKNLCRNASGEVLEVRFFARFYRTMRGASPVTSMTAIFI